MKLGNQGSKTGCDEPPDGSVSAALPVRDWQVVFSGNRQYAGALVCRIRTWSKGAPSFSWIIESIGYLGFKFMIPIARILPGQLAINPRLLRRLSSVTWRMTKACSARNLVRGSWARSCSAWCDWHFGCYFRKVKLGKALQPLLGSMLILRHAVFLVF